MPEGVVEVRGIATPAPVWQVLRPSAFASRFEVLPPTITGIRQENG